jgi:hypothetical protein
VQKKQTVLRAYLASTEGPVRLYVKMLCALAYLPPGEVRDGFLELRASAEFPQELHDLYK